MERHLDEWIPLSDAAKELAVSYAKAWTMVLTGGLKGTKNAGRWMVDRADLDRILQSRVREAKR